VICADMWVRWFVVCWLVVVVRTYQPQGVDPYEALGLERGSDIDAKVLKRAFRKAALRWHPDKVGEMEKEEAEQRFVEIAWAYEVLSDPGRRTLYDTPGSTSSGTGSGAQPGPRDFSMSEAARVFRDVFGKKSNEYQDLVHHLSTASGRGNKEYWKQHAADILKELERNGGKDFNVETRAKDGSEWAKTSRTSSNGGATQTTVTEHSVTSSGPASLGGHAHAALHASDPHNAHLAAHNAAHEAAVRAAQAAAGLHLPGSEL